MTSSTKLLDSSVWIEILGSGPLLKACQKEMRAAKIIIVPTIICFEVYRKIARSTTEDKALSAIAIMTQHQVSELTQDIALSAGDISLQFRLGMADSLVLAHANKAGCTLVTLDNDFANIPGVRVLR